MKGAGIYQAEIGTYKEHFCTLDENASGCLPTTFVQLQLATKLGCENRKAKEPYCLAKTYV
jgi:hypothetical protein